MRAGFPVQRTHVRRYLVRASDTVPQLRPGSSLDEGESVLASAVLLTLFEAACWDVLAPWLAEHETRLGTHFLLDHVSPAAPGDIVQIAVTCTGLYGEKALWWRTEAHNVSRNGVLVGTMRHEMRLVDGAVFRERLTGRYHSGNAAHVLSPDRAGYTS